MVMQYLLIVDMKLFYCNQECKKEKLIYYYFFFHTSVDHNRYYQSALVTEIR